MGKILGFGLLTLILILALSWILTGNDFFLYKVFAPQQAKVERQVFENSPSFVEGKKTYIAQLEYDYKTADKGHKAALRSLILSEAASVDNTLLPADQQAFICSLKEEVDAQ